MKTIGQILQLSQTYLAERGIARPRLQAEEVVSLALEMKRLDLYLDFERPLADEELVRCRAILARRGEGEPIQYIRGEVDFYDCRIKVTPDVLIPRPETEQLVEHLLKSLSGHETVWDVCCGSGCIAIALKKARPTLTVAASDISTKALTVARENAALNGVEIELLEGDLLAPFEGRRGDVVVSNPPYVKEEEFSTLQSEVRDFEPKIAHVPGAQGTECYTRLAATLPDYLTNAGRVWLEIGATQGEAVKGLFSRWIDGQLLADWEGRDRFFTAQLIPNIEEAKNDQPRIADVHHRG